jgi:hypothetical protein
MQNHEQSYLVIAVTKKWMKNIQKKMRKIPATYIKLHNPIINLYRDSFDNPETK